MNFKAINHQRAKRRIGVRYEFQVAQEPLEEITVNELAHSIDDAKASRIVYYKGVVQAVIYGGFMQTISKH